MDGYWERGLNAWDVAAGLLLVREAGGFTGPIREGQDLLESGNVLAANAEIFEPFAKIIRARD